LTIEVELSRAECAAPFLAKHIEEDIGDVHQRVVPKADELVRRIGKTIVQA
jgi:hypothetical protein